MSTAEVDQPASDGAATSEAAAPAPTPDTPPNPDTPPSPDTPGSGRPGRRRRLRGWRLLVLLVVVALLILGCLALVRGLISAQGADDPGSPRGNGSAAVAQLLRDQGVGIERVDDVDRAASAVRRAASGSGGSGGTAAATLVIVHPDRLDAAQVAELTAARAARTVLIAPSGPVLTAFGISGSAAPAPDADDVEPACSDADAVRAGSLTMSGATAYRVPTALSCYPDGNGAAYYAQVVTAAGRVDLVGNPFANATLGADGNAAFATAVLGSQPTLVWLMTPTTPTGAADQPPGLLPPWWPAAVVQALIALAVLGAWQGRRLGPIIAERLPVLVRAGETVEGHGRLYQRLEARDRAAAALRTAVIARLGPRFGTGPGGAGVDPAQLSRQLADRTGRDPAQILSWLAGPAPADDDALNTLARDLDRLEQEARQL